jgi:hypothetical protein
MKFNKLLIVSIFAAIFLAQPAHSQSVLAQNEDAFVISHMRTSVAAGMFSAFTFGLGGMLEANSTTKQKRKWAKVIEVAKASGCTSLAVASGHHDDPEIAIRGTADSRGRPTYLRSNGGHFHYADPYDNGGYWSTVKVAFESLNTMFICAHSDTGLHKSFKTVVQLEKDLKLEGMLD